PIFLSIFNLFCFRVVSLNSKMVGFKINSINNRWIHKLIIEKMDTNSLIIGAVLIAICIIPLVLISRKGRQRTKQMKNGLAEIALKNNCKINKMGTTSNIAIGIDGTKKCVV